MLTFATTSCSDDDEKEDEKQVALTGGVWKITFFSIDGDLQVLDQCERLETFEFLENGTFVQKLYSSNDAEDGCDLDTERKGKWVNSTRVKFFDLTFDEDTFQNITMNLGIRSLGYGYDVQNEDQLLQSYSVDFEK